MMCVTVQVNLCAFSWDNGENEKMSPWDLEPLDAGRELAVVCLQYYMDINMGSSCFTFRF